MNIRTSRVKAELPGRSTTATFSEPLQEHINLKDVNGQIIVSATYDDENGWPLTADGWGDPLMLGDKDQDPNDPKSWYASPQLYGSPGSN